MPITKVVQGDLIEMALNGEFDVICHGVNCRGVMGSGIAKQIRDTWPEVYDSYRQYVESHGSLGFQALGENLIISGFTANARSVRSVVNMFTQYDYGGGRQVDYCAVKNCFRKLHETFLGDDYEIGIPMIGAGLAGGDWELIKRIINTNTPHLDITLVEYQK